MDSKAFARMLRRKQTDPEAVLWYNLRDRRLEGAKFRRQHRVAGYVVDFVCLERLLIIEIDGGQHARQERYDALRSDTLTKQRFRTIRFWNNEVLRDLDAVLQAIRAALTDSPSP